VPYLSWSDGGAPHRHFLQEDCFVGRDPLLCPVANPHDPTLSRRHASLHKAKGTWWVKDLESANGTTLNGLALDSLLGNAVGEGDELEFGDWKLRFSFGFPGLDGENCIERVGSIFEEVHPEPQQAMALLRGLELLHTCTESLLSEREPSAILRGLLDEAMKLFRAERGFLVMQGPERGWITAHRVGDIQEHLGLSRSVLDYVSVNATAVLSNVPMGDPRFGGSSLVEFQRGPLLCAPLELDGKVLGVIYLDRNIEATPFVRFDLALLQSLVHQGSLILRHSNLSSKALGQAEVEGELFRLKALHQRTVDGYGELMSAMRNPVRWLQSWAKVVDLQAIALLEDQAERLGILVEEGLARTHVDVPDPGASISLESLQGQLERPWANLLSLQKVELVVQHPPKGFVWIASNHAIQALVGLVEPLLLQIPEHSTLAGTWSQDPGIWILQFNFPPVCHGPTPDAWTSRTIQSAGIRWRWVEQCLSIQFAQGPETVPEETPRPLMGLVTEEYQLLGLFQSVAEAGDLNLFPLEAEPPLPPLPRFRYLVLDAGGLEDPVGCIQAYRRHPSFTTAPILVVRVPDDLTSAVLSAGATDWLPEGFRWEALHHRLQVLRGHDELQRKARAVERLDSFRQMAGTLKHEINNPLAVISMQIELLERKYPEEPKLKKIEQMVDRIRDLVQVLQKMREAATVDYADGSSIVQLPNLPKVFGS
jgi:signal transduction histidine kinase